MRVGPLWHPKVGVLLDPHSFHGRKYSPWKRGHARVAIVLIEQLRQS